MLPTCLNCFCTFPKCIRSPKIFDKTRFYRFQKKNVISEPLRPQIELKIAVSESSRCPRPVWNTFGRFRKNHFSTENLHFARVTFQFSVHGLAARTVSADIGAVSERTFRKLVGVRAVSAAVAEKSLQNGAKHSPPGGRSWKKDGPTASGALRSSSRFLRGFSGTPAKTALVHTSFRKVLPETAPISAETFLADCSWEN